MPSDPYDLRLGEYFTLRELARTGHRSLAERNLLEASASPVLDNLRALAVDLLDPLRRHYGRPVVVHSGYRCPALNKAIGGARRSQHLTGDAADFHVSGVALADVFDWIRGVSGLFFSQVILEGVVAGRPTWVHLGRLTPAWPPERAGEALAWDAKGGYREVT